MCPYKFRESSSAMTPTRMHESRSPNINIYLRITTTKNTIYSNTVSQNYTRPPSYHNQHPPKTTNLPPRYQIHYVQPTSLRCHPPRQPPNNLPPPPRHVHPTTNYPLHSPLLRLLQSRASPTLEHAPARTALRSGDVRPAHESREEVAGEREGKS